MTELDANLVRRKLATIAAILSDLAPIESLSLVDYRRERFRQKGTERLLQETVEAAVDANLHLLRASGVASPTDYYDSFIQVGRRGIIRQDLADRLAPAAGLRNRLVPEYDAIDDGIVLRAVASARRDFAEYVSAVERYLSDAGY